MNGVAAPPDRAPSTSGRGRSAGRLLPVALLVLLAISCIWALTFGSRPLRASEVLEALARFDGSPAHMVVLHVRLPRVLAGVMVGAALAVAGAIMQAATNNPLASPGLLGVNAGAAFAVVMAIVLLDVQASSEQAWFAFAGAALAALAVYSTASVGTGGATPLKLALAGAVLATFLTALSTAVLIFDARTLDQIRLWSAGSLSGRSLAAVRALAPYTVVGLVAAVVLRGQIMTLSLGAEVARAVGQNIVLWRSLAAGVVVLLAGSAVALAGPIPFVGLVVPHMVRLFIGIDYRRIIPLSALCGALLVVGADTLARTVVPGEGLPVGIAMALVGAPLFIYLARYRTGRVA